MITAVSGGSFTALAYGLYGDQMFVDYEQRFLKRDVQGAIIARTFNPLNWGDLWLTGWGRSELAADLYGEHRMKQASCPMLALAALAFSHAAAKQYVYPAKGQSSQQAAPMLPTTATGTTPGAGLRGTVAGKVIRGDARAGAVVGVAAARGQSRCQNAAASGLAAATSSIRQGSRVLRLCERFRGMTLRTWLVAAALAWGANAFSADFGSKGGPEPTNIDEVTALLRQDPYDLELLISFGTSKGGSAGHLALAIRDAAPRDDLVYSANFYADRTRKHESGWYTKELMLGIPKQEYLFKTVSSLADTASFGLDFGEIYKRSVVGVRVYGVPAGEKEALAAYFKRINDDYRNQARNTEYHDGEIKYDYMRLNCAKTIGSAFKFGAGYENLEVTSAKILSRRRVVVAAKANIPTEMAMKLIHEWSKRGYGMDVVLYKKYGQSTYVDPHEEENVAFKDLPNRFPSVLSRDFRREEGEYKDYDNLFSMYLFYNLSRYSVRVNEQTLLLEIEKTKQPLDYREATELATRSAQSDSDIFRRRSASAPSGTRIGETADR